MSTPDIRLDHSKEIIPPEGFVIVDSEIDFLRHDGAQKLWVRGDLCDFVRSVYRARQIDIIEVVSPRTRLRGLVGPVADTLNLTLVSSLFEILEKENPSSLSELLFQLTQDDFWTLEPSIKHGARFLTINIDVALADLVDAQRKVWLTQSQEAGLDEIYSQNIAKRDDFLQKWLLDGSVRERLGEFPIPLPDEYGLMLTEAVAKSLRSSNGSAVSDFPKLTVNKKFYAAAAIDYFSHNSVRLTSDILSRMSALLTTSERIRLEHLLPSEALGPIPIESDLETAFEWATRIYLPFRSQQLTNNSYEEADSLAESFTNWLLENYPKLTSGDREDSPINLRTFYKVKSLAESYSVLWVVVDGLSYSNHQKLLELLGERSANLRIAENYPLFAVLPTITEKAKYGLTTGRFPQENSKRDWDIKNNFLANFPDGVYAGNSGMPTLAEGLKRESPTVCYWNYTRLDKCFHEQTGLLFLLDEVENQLRALADHINRLVSAARDKDQVAVVICSDHGQMINHCRLLDIDFGDRFVHGRTALSSVSEKFPHPNSAFVTTNNGETVYLNPTSFRLSEATTVALGATYFVDLKANEHQGAIGVHGGLFPEEVVVGLGVLMREPMYKPLLVALSGSGEAGHSGTIFIEIDNPNSVTVNPLELNVQGLEFENQGELLISKVGPQQLFKLELSLTQFPQPTAEESFRVDGALRFEYEDGRQEECPVNGTLGIKSLYNTRNPGILDRFKK